MSGDNTIQAMQTDSECESEPSSVAGDSHDHFPPLNREHLVKRIDSLAQENRVLKVELETYKLRLKASQEEIKQLRHDSVNMQARAEQEEEFISNTLLKKIQELKKEKETLANNYEREEEYLTNDLSRKLAQLREEKQSLEQSLEQEQASQINKLMRRIKRLEADTMNKHSMLEQLKREKIELENTLEKEQESLVNRLWKRMEKLETDKRLLQERLDHPVPSGTPSSGIGADSISTSSSNSLNPSSSTDILHPASSSCIPLLINDNSNNSSSHGTDGRQRLSLPNVDHIQQLRREVEKLKRELFHTQEIHRASAERYVREERDIRNENLRLQRKLQLEMDRREQLCRQLSESESSLEMDEERMLNDRLKLAHPSSKVQPSSSTSLVQPHLSRSRTVSSPSSQAQQAGQPRSASNNSSNAGGDFQKPRPPSADME